LERSFKQAGNLIAELIPKIYDTEREIEILGEDERPKVIQINKQHIDESGQMKHYDMTKGKYSLVVTVGKAFNSKRMETFDTMQQVLATQPNLMPTIGDIFFRNSDLAGSEQLAERFHKMLPPQLQDDKQNQLPPQAQAVMAQSQQQMQAMQGELQKLQFERQAKVAEHQGKMQQIQMQAQADMALEDKKLQTQIAVAEIQTKAQMDQERAQFVEDLWKQFHGQAHEAGLAAQKHAHSRVMASQAHEQAQQQAEMMAAQQQAQPEQVSQ